MFVGSSTDGLPIAEAVRGQLEATNTAAVTVWSDGVFGPGEYVLSKLLDIADGFDFSLMVMSAADIVTSEGTAKPIPRDNVLIELGIFLATLGQLRTFFLYDENNPPKIASDLKGVIPLTFKGAEDNGLEAALSDACGLMTTRIEKRGRRQRPGEARAVDSPRILCAGTSEYESLGFGDDVKVIQQRYGEESVVVLERVDRATLVDALTDGIYDVLHLVAFFDFSTGRLVLEDGESLGPKDFAAALDQGEVQLAVLASCNSMGLIARVGEVTNMVGATDLMDEIGFQMWVRQFYKQLSRGQRLSEAAEAARKVADAPIRLMLKEEMVLPATLVT